MNESRYQKLSDTEYDRVSDSKPRWDIEEAYRATLAMLQQETVSADLLEDYAWKLTKASDKKRTSRTVAPGQLNLLTGEVDALDAIWSLGGGQRTKARKARRVEMLAWLSLRGENARAVAEAYEEDQRTVVALLVYMDTDEVTVEHAVRAYREDHMGAAAGPE